jgi:hypothetical protein
MAGVDLAICRELANINDALMHFRAGEKGN